MSDLIDRQALLKTLNENKIEFDSDVNYFIMHAPSAQPEIIRCKDCKFKNHYQFPPKYDKKGYCEKHEKIINEIDYCSWAERRNDE